MILSNPLNYCSHIVEYGIQHSRKYYTRKFKKGFKEELALKTKKIEIDEKVIS
ncbi:hypothetical protein [Caldicellulosiruptor naganoensis]|uniref:Transposase n=1 Tax=Caldicellulosiruptor naganoensis TaxID=29324 RepID=A0ABY7BGP7_9FIRM|nr:hypothetical protein [Caldicellulosiruptor naganoensis]WAM31507.1 hypothetical protein OTJ99_002392 [Caldicellulosiruptor naganoensis]